MDFNYQSIAPDGTAVFAHDNQLLVKFSVHSELSQYKSKLKGMPIYDDVEIVTILNPGEKEPVIVQADEFHKRRFPKQYEAFKQGLSVEHTGTPLEMLFPSQPSTVKALKVHNIYSIQQLSRIDDNAISQIPMGRSLVEKAQKYLAEAQSGQGFHQMEEMQRKIDQLTALVAEAGIQPPEPPAERRGPGRPRKEKEVA